MYGLLDGKKIGLSLAHSLMGGMRCFIHLVMGFGLNEVYIMAAHWAFIIPVCIGYIIRNCKEKYLPYLRGTLAVITIFLFFYNSTLIFEYLTR